MNLMEAGHDGSGSCLVSWMLSLYNCTNLSLLVGEPLFAESVEVEIVSVVVQQVVEFLVEHVL